jgi:sulfite exporter TauE/SafE
MDWGVVATGLLLGLTASLSCLGICMPILLPYIIEKDKTLKEGLFTSVIFSIGRLIIYITLGFVVFIIGSAAAEESPERWLKIAVAILGLVVIIYGAWIVFNLPKPNWCPAKLAKNFRPIFSFILGLLIGSFFCPALWTTLLLSVTVSRDFSTLLFSVITFWLGSSVMIIVAGTVTGEVGGRWGKRIGFEKLRDISGMVLMMAGAFYLISGLS